MSVRRHGFLMQVKIILVHLRTTEFRRVVNPESDSTVTMATYSINKSQNNVLIALCQFITIMGYKEDSNTIILSEFSLVMD